MVKNLLRAYIPRAKARGFTPSFGFELKAERFVCNHCAKGNRKSQEDFVCLCCEYANNADIVGTMNVCRAGHAHLTCRDIGNVSSQAQETTGDAA